jgi:hypothetical protein
VVAARAVAARVVAAERAREMRVAAGRAQGNSALPKQMSSMRRGTPPEDPQGSSTSPNYGCSMSCRPHHHIGDRFAGCRTGACHPSELVRLWHHPCLHQTTRLVTSISSSPEYHCAPRGNCFDRRTLKRATHLNSLIRCC